MKKDEQDKDEDEGSKNEAESEQREEGEGVGEQGIDIDSGSGGGGEPSPSPLEMIPKKEDKFDNEEVKDGKQANDHDDGNEIGNGNASTLPQHDIDKGTDTNKAQDEAQEGGGDVNDDIIDLSTVSSLHESASLFSCINSNIKNDVIISIGSDNGNGADYHADADISIVVDDDDCNDDGDKTDVVDIKTRFEASFEEFDVISTTKNEATRSGMLGSNGGNDHEQNNNYQAISPNGSFLNADFAPPLPIEIPVQELSMPTNMKKEIYSNNNNYLDASSPVFSNTARRTRVAATTTPVGAGPDTTIILRAHKAEKSEIFKFLRTGTANNNDHNNDKLNPALQRRLRDFDFAQRKRRERYGERSPWGIIGLYHHLIGIRTDIEWAEDAAWRREHGEPYLSWSDFEDAKDTGWNQAFFTYIVMFVCTVCLILSIAVNGWKVEPLTVNPMIGPSANTLIMVGAKKTSLIVNENQWYRLFSPMVLHAGIIHFVLNMLALWFIGYAVEQSHGFLNVMILFIVPAVGGTIMSALFLPEYISVGASGGIFGLIGACLADIVTNWNLLFSKAVNKTDDGSRYRHIKVLIWLILDILLNVLIGMTPFVDNFTHVGGMLYGFLCGLTKLERLSMSFFGVQQGFFHRFRQHLIQFFGMILSIVCIIISVIVLAKSDGGRIEKCRGCRYVSCVPFPFWSSYENKWWYCDDCDLVSADARQDRVTGAYSSMNMTCPDGAIENIDLKDEITDAGYLQRQLPNYCRDYCENLFMN